MAQLFERLSMRLFCKPIEQSWSILLLWVIKPKQCKSSKDSMVVQTNGVKMMHNKQLVGISEIRLLDILPEHPLMRPSLMIRHLDGCCYAYIMITEVGIDTNALVLRVLISVGLRQQDAQQTVISRQLLLILNVNSNSLRSYQHHRFTYETYTQHIQ